MAGMTCPHRATLKRHLHTEVGAEKPKTGLQYCVMEQKEHELWHHSGQANIPLVTPCMT